MEHMKQCPQCGKYVAADRTYCMNCGVTLGIRCPDCRTVVPVGAKACTQCGHSFVKKKKKLNIPLWDWSKKNAKPLTGGLCILLLIFTLVAAAFPGVNLTVFLEEAPFLEHTATGYDLMGYFLGGHPESIESLLALKELKDDVPVLKVLLFAEGLGWLIALVGLALAITLLAPNYKRFGKKTASRLFAPLGAALGGGALAFGLTPVTASILAESMSKYTGMAEEGYLVDTATALPLALLISLAAVAALYTLLYLAVFSRMPAGEDSTETAELSLGHILAVPVKALAYLIHRLVRKLRKKKGGRLPERDEPAFTVTHRFTTYLILFVVALVFTQALLSKVSNIFFWFIFLLPLVLLVYVLLAKNALSVSMLSDTVTTEKNTPYTYEFLIRNHSPLALPFIDAQVSIPQSNSVRCTERTIRLSMAPLSGYHVKNTVSFRFRGTYDIGVRCFYIYDFFRIFRVRVDVENLTTVYVLPRRLTLEETSAHSVSDDTARTVRSPLVVDKLEVSDIRDYRNGDSLKSIHWKLSSKSETFIVKDYNTGTSNQTVVFCDLTPHFPDEPPKQKATAEADEEAVSSADSRKKLTRAQRKAAKKAEQEAAKTRSDLRRKHKRIKETKDTHAISDEALEARLSQRAAVADKLDAMHGDAESLNEAILAAAAAAPVEAVDVHELAKPVFYEDMNEYLADGVVELTIASVLAELRKGHEVLLLWFDRRSDTGVFGYSLRGADEFETIYHLFATAPLCSPERKVTSLTAMISDIQSAKQMFVISTLDTLMLTDLSSLPGVSDAGSFGSAEVVLYNPEERFLHPRERANYLEGCREQLAASGLALTAGAFNVTKPEGGNIHEAKE